ncbi:MAG: hypothetical protein R3F61_07145 [Myxococcota bacterium]
MRTRARTRRATVLDAPAPACAHAHRTAPFTLGDLSEPLPKPTWDPAVLGDLTAHLHERVPRAPSEAPGPLVFPHLDRGAAHALWRSAAWIEESAIRVPLARADRDVLALGASIVAYCGVLLTLFAAPAFVYFAANLTAPQHGAHTTAALSGGVSELALAVFLAGVVVALLGTALTSVGGYGMWTFSRTSVLQIGLHGIQLGRKRWSYDEILRVDADSGSLVFQLLDGSEVRTPPSTLDTLVASSLSDEIRSHLPSDEDRAAGFVAYERARQAMRIPAT